MIIVEDNILCHKDGPSDHNGSHENWFQGYKIDLKTHAKPCNSYIAQMPVFAVLAGYFELASALIVYPSFSSIFDIFIYIHEYANEIIFI